MKTAIIVHGMPSKENYLSSPAYRSSERHWVPWLKRELESRGYFVSTPEMPKPYDPDYQAWAAEFKKCPRDENTLLVGHSCGGGFLVRWLSENKVKVGKVVLVAPWVDPNKKFAPNMFGEFEVDSELTQYSDGVVEFISTDDDQEELDTLEILKKRLPGLQVRLFHDRGHFLVPEVPELLEEVLKSSQ